MTPTILAPKKIGNDIVCGIGFGAMGMSGFRGAIESDEKRMALLDVAYETGSRHWDTANVYRDSEDVIGKWFKRTGKRNEIFLATKFGMTPDGPCGRPEYVNEAFSKSSEGLGVDFVDLYYLHRVDKNVPIEITVGAMANLVKAGKVKYLGLSECSAGDLRRAHSVHPISAVQMDYSPLYLNLETSGILDACKELGITIVCYSPLAKGLITGAFESPDDFKEDDLRRTVPRFSRENFAKILTVVENIRAIGKVHNATPGQVTLAWILAQGPEFVVIPGTKKIDQLKENIGAAIVKLSSDEIAAIRKVGEASIQDIPGERYSGPPAEWVLAQSPRLESCDRDCIV